MNVAIDINKHPLCQINQANPTLLISRPRS